MLDVFVDDPGIAGDSNFGQTIEVNAVEIFVETRRKRGWLGMERRDEMKPASVVKGCRRRIRSSSRRFRPENRRVEVIARRETVQSFSKSESIR